MAHNSKSKRPRKSRSHSVHKPLGVIHPCVQAVGPGHFAFVCIDCARARSRSTDPDEGPNNVVNAPGEKPK
jgi:hypothetical protein